MQIRLYAISALTNIFTDYQSGVKRLNMVGISNTKAFASFAELCERVLVELRYPQEQDQKLETYAFTLSTFNKSTRTGTRKDGSSFSRTAIWRKGASEVDGLSAFYCDVDNANPDHPHVTRAEVERKLQELGLSYFGYTSYSHSPAQEKFRVIIDLDRCVTRSELLRLAVFLDWNVFGHQADMSIYDPGDCLFAPPFCCETFSMLDGAPLVVDQALGALELLQKEEPSCWSRTIARQQPVQRAKLVPVADGLEERRRVDRTVRPEISIDNPVVFNPAWETLYRDRVCGGHWETMRSLLGMIWVKTGGTLSYGEMRHILDQIDTTAAGYLLRVHGEQKAVEIIDFIMSCEIEAREDDSCSLLEAAEIGMTVQVKEAECGQGKTRDELLRIAGEKRRYVYVVDKIDNISKRLEEFYSVAGDAVASSFFIREAHSENPLRVPLQLVNIRKDLMASTSALVFVTHASAAQMDWSDWTDFEIIVDEVPDCFHLFQIKAGHHVHMLKRYLKVIGTDGNCYALAATEEGLQLARRTDIDDYEKVHHGLCVMLAKPGNHVWVKQVTWDQVEDGGNLDFFALSSPLNLSPFRSVRLLGDEAMSSVTVRAWKEKWSVDFEPIDFPRRTRAKLTADRVTIKYVSDNRDSSITRFQEADMPLEKLTAWIRQDAAGEPVLWTANERLRSRCRLSKDDYIPPKAHGRNDLQHYKRVAWLAAMKASKFEIGTLRAICGMTAQELVDWREFNAMYQFVMRCILRDFDSDEPAVIYVFSRQQAEYLHRRLGGVMEKIDGVVLDRPARCYDAEGAMTPAERKKVAYWRDKMIDAGLADVRDLPKGEKLSEREVRLVNRTSASIIAARAIGQNGTHAQ